MEHEIFIDGTVKKYSWSIRTGNEVVNQIREHPPAYLSGGKLDVKNTTESKFIALHVGIYWGLGVFIIKDYDEQLTNHRNLKINYQITEQENNLATKQLSSEGDASTGKNSREYV